jgi:hypothetical protein
MKKQALSLVGVLSLLLAAGSALAQSGAIRADVPFSFTVNGTTMPAGPYTVSQIANGINTLLIQSDNGKEVKLVIPYRVESRKTADRSKLVFHCYSNRDHCFLHQIWVQGRDVGQEFPKTSLEKEVAAASLRPQDVPVIASRR